MLPCLSPIQLDWGFRVGYSSSLLSPHYGVQELTLQLLNDYSERTIAVQKNV